MSSYSDHVTVIDNAVAGPSNSHVTPCRRQPRKAAALRRKARPVPPEDIIEISDSDDEGPHARSAAATPTRRGILGGGAQTGTPDRHPRAPLFLPDDDNDSDDDILAILNADDDLSAASPRVSMSPQDKGKRRADMRPADRFDSPLRLPIPLSAANTPPASHEDVLTANRIPRLVAQVLEIVPDVDKSYLEELIALQMDSRSFTSGSDWGDDDNLCAQVIDAVLHNLFENAQYPKRREKTPSHVQSPSSLAAGSSKARLHFAPGTGKGNDSTASGSQMSGAPHSGEDAVADGSHSSSSATAEGSGPSAPHPPEPIQDPVSRIMAQVLEIIPDVEPTFLRDLVQRHLEAHHVEPADPAAAKFDPCEVALQRTLHGLFEKPDYPKASRKRKRASDEGAEEAGPAKTRKVEGPDYGSKDRARTGGKYYDELSLNQLSQDFPGVPYDQLHQRFAEHNRLYAPTYLSLRAERREAAAGSDSKARSSGRKRKGKGKARHDSEFDKERAWLLRKLQEEATLHDVEEDEGEGLECGCCFTSYPISKMTQCPDAHLFCVDCVTNYASTLLGEHNPAIGCMDQSGCKLLFPPSELRRILTPKLLELYERVTQRKELEAAGLENLEECPFCEYQVVIENDQEKLFRCEREECGAVSCRKCKKLDHLPKSCEEAAEDKKLDARHAIEEAMTAALMRNCPSCKKAFIKEAGCNKMVCPNCRTLSCYICRKIIHGYDHFNQAPPYNMPKDGSKCPLWDSDIERRHAEEVVAAAQKAQEEYKRAHPEVNEADIKVDLPKAPSPKRGVCNNPNHRHDLHHRHYAPVPPPAAPPIPGPAMRAHDPLLRAMEARQRMAPRAHLGYDAQAAVAYAQGQYLPLPIAPPMPVHPAHPAHPVHPLPAALPYLPHPHHPHLPVAPAIPPAVAAPLQHVRRNPPRGVPMAQGMVQMMGNAGMLGPEVLNEGLRRPHRADRAHSRPVKVARHR